MKKLLLAAILLFAGTAFAQHSVTLNWTASPDAASNPSLSYRVYKASGQPCATASSFTLLNSTAAGVLTFTDTSVAVGQTDSYEVTSVLNGTEGPPSTCAQAVILPASPSGLTATPH